ncbi:MAG TPA: hypothetical protein VGI13_12975 [Candidatus Acidoferrum sp.]
MLTRPGSKPGPSWMRNISESMADPDRIHKIMMPFWAFFILFMVACVAVTHLVTAVALSKDYVYESATRIAGLPLVSYSPAAHGIIALGVRATGVVAVGGVAVGFIAIGGVALGAISLGGISVGMLALAGIAIGWRAFGGLAIGRAALGAFAVGNYAYAGTGIAYGSTEASGRQKEHLIG